VRHGALKKNTTEPSIVKKFTKEVEKYLGFDMMRLLRRMVSHPLVESLIRFVSMIIVLATVWITYVVFRDYICKRKPSSSRPS
jgi:hypothetical protein